MSNGQICCLTGVCCPPGSPEQREALEGFLREECRFDDRAVKRHLAKYDEGVKTHLRKGDDDKDRT